MDRFVRLYSLGSMLWTCAAVVSCFGSSGFKRLSPTRTGTAPPPPASHGRSRPRFLPETFTPAFFNRECAVTQHIHVVENMWGGV
eukprot:2076393-Prymnesium_polylepis.1